MGWTWLRYTSCSSTRFSLFPLPSALLLTLALSEQAFTLRRATRLDRHNQSPSNSSSAVIAFRSAARSARS